MQLKFNLSEFANGKPIEYGEIYDVHGNSLVDLIVGMMEVFPYLGKKLRF